MQNLDPNIDPSKLDWTICGFCDRDLKNWVIEDCPHQDDYGRYKLIISGIGLESYDREMKRINKAKSKSKYPECWESIKEKKECRI